MYYIYVGDDYCSEEVYKTIVSHKIHETIIGLSENSFDERKALFLRIFPEATVLCDSGDEKRAEIINAFSPTEFFHLSDDIILELSEAEINKLSCRVEIIGQGTRICTVTNRFRVKKKKSIRQLLDEKGFVRIIESTCGLTSMLLQQLSEVNEKGEEIQFDAFWMSSLCDSLHRGRPDQEITDLSDRLHSFTWIHEISDRPVMFDLDSGGNRQQFLSSLITLYNRGVSAVVIEDKIGEKINSLSDSCQLQNQDSVTKFAEKIRLGRALIDDSNFMVIARIESLILGKGIEEAVFRAGKYIEAKADAILIHYNKSNYNVIKEFCEKYNKLPNRKPLVVVPTKYSAVTEEELQSWGVNMVIYANQITRSIVPAVINTGKMILKNRRALEASVNCISVKETLNLVEDNIDVI